MARRVSFPQDAHTDMKAGTMAAISTPLFVPQMMGRPPPGSCEGGLLGAPTLLANERAEGRNAQSTVKIQMLPGEQSDGLDTSQEMPEDYAENSASREISTRHRKVIKKRVRNRYGHDTRHMGFIKQYLINETTGRANQLFQCMFCHIKTPKLCNMIDHQKTHSRERATRCPNCFHNFMTRVNLERHRQSGTCGKRPEALFKPADESRLHQME